MTEHILNFSIGLDDEGIRAAVQEKAEKEIIKDLKQDVIKKIFVSRYCGSSPIKTGINGDIKIDKDAELTDLAKTVIKDSFEEVKEEIIERASKYLCDSMRRSKSIKEKIEKSL